MTPKQNIILAVGLIIIVYDFYKSGGFVSNSQPVSPQTAKSQTVFNSVTSNPFLRARVGGGG